MSETFRRAWRITDTRAICGGCDWNAKLEKGGFGPAKAHIVQTGHHVFVTRIMVAEMMPFSEAIEG